MWYESLYPRKKVLIATIIFLILWVAGLFLLTNGTFCSTCVFSSPDNICEQKWPMIIQNCDCCFTATDFFNQLLIFIIIPAVIMYLIYAILFYKRDKNIRKSNK